MVTWSFCFGAVAAQYLVLGACDEEGRAPKERQEGVGFQYPLHSTLCDLAFFHGVPSSRGSTTSEQYPQTGDKPFNTRVFGRYLRFQLSWLEIGNKEKKRKGKKKKENKIKQQRVRRGGLGTTSKRKDTESCLVLSCSVFREAEPRSDSLPSVTVKLHCQRDWPWKPAWSWQSTPLGVSWWVMEE